ncbi:MAG TPA: tRNA pseudouridine(38-40) synthase TruA [Anaerolineae bacterium]
MTRLLAILEYDGTDFEGFQVQKRGRTVQGELEGALREITGEEIRVVGAGRTDSGVHALGQGAHFDTEWSRPPELLHRALNGVLPNDMAVRSIVPVAPDFSARYNARSRAYRYTILNQPHRSPLTCRYALHAPESLDVDAMDAAARCLLGSQDFGAFGTPPQGQNTVREMIRAQVQKAAPTIQIDLEANAFLYRMVRRIVGTLLWVGKGEMSVEEFRTVIAKKRRAGQSVPPHGLCLVAVHYDL